MFTHNLKIAFRNMRKYFNQTLISVMGLAVGFTCFALATLWIRYEMSFDDFHKNARNMYAVYAPASYVESGYIRAANSYRLASYMKETFPEIADAISLSYNGFAVTIDEERIPTSILVADTSFFRMFDVKILEGSREFLIPGSNKAAITRKKAQELFPSGNPIGKTFTDFFNKEFTICAVITEISERSNYAFDMIVPFDERRASDVSFETSGIQTLIKLHPKVNVKLFEKKLYEHNIVTAHNRNINSLKIIPIKKMRYTDPNIMREVEFQHVVIFSISGLLIILLALLNYITLFVSRFRIRQKELALRMVCGASGRSLMAMLSMEFIITLLFAVVLGCTLTQWLYKHFLSISKIKIGLSAIYLETLAYIGIIIIISLLSFWLILLIFRHRSLNMSIRRSNKNISRKMSVILQLVISIGFAFCTAVIMKQMHYLHNSDEIGFSFKNRGSVTIWEVSMSGADVLTNHLRQIPEIKNVVNADGMNDLFVPTVRVFANVTSWDDRPVEADEINMENFAISPEYFAFFELQTSLGEMLTDSDTDLMVLLNETAVKLFGWHDPIGKRIITPHQTYTVKGVLKNVYNFAPTIETKPIMYTKKRNHPMAAGGFDGHMQIIRVALFEYHENIWQSCKEKIEKMVKEQYPDLIYNISNTEERFNEFLKSEKVLIWLLSFVSGICLLICIFGFVSLVSLTCEERRKSIAIRKVNGATAGDILGMFAKEYFLLLFIGAAIAFPAGHLIMQRWLENYMIRTNIPAWIYLAIVCALVLVIVVCVGWQVYKSSVENPAEVVKSE